MCGLDALFCNSVEVKISRTDAMGRLTAYTTVTSGNGAIGTRIRGENDVGARSIAPPLFFLLPAGGRAR